MQKRQKNRLLIFLSLCSLWSCSTGEDRYWIEFQVYADRHRFFTTQKLQQKRLDEKIESDRLEFKAYFESACLYDTAGFGSDAGDQNKLFGLTLNGSDPLKGSVMWAWNHMEPDSLTVSPFYNRANGTHMYVQAYTGAVLGKVKVAPEIIHNYCIEKSGDSVYWYFDEQLLYVIPTSEIGTDVNGLRFYTLPWFGGQQPAPNDMKIHIRLPF